MELISPFNISYQSSEMLEVDMANKSLFSVLANESNVRTIYRGTIAVCLLAVFKASNRFLPSCMTNSQLLQRKCMLWDTFAFIYHTSSKNMQRTAFFPLSLSCLYINIRENWTSCTEMTFFWGNSVNHTRIKSTTKLCKVIV